MTRSSPSPLQPRRFSALVLFVCLVLPTAAGAQEKPADSSGKNSSARQDQPRSGGIGRQLAKESREAAGEDENEAFKHSASVQWIAQHTGLSLGQAYWLSVLLNFAVIAGAIVWVSKKKLPGFFSNRTASIQQAMQAARQASEEANRRLADIEARLSHLGAEIGEMRAAAENEAVAEAARMKGAAEEDARRIVESAEQEIAAAAKSARRELKAYAADLAVSIATQQIKVDSATDQGLVRNFTDHLASAEPNRTGSNGGKDGH
jgi:F-type H+-transporting ATPase subunit b